jgi:hypothetical protein
MEQHYSTKHAGIDLPAQFMIGQLDGAAMGKAKLLYASAVPAYHGVGRVWKGADTHTLPCC